MKLTYQTGIATLIQLIVLSALTFISQIFSVVDTCTKDDGNCLGNLATSIILYLLVAIVFGSIWLIGLGAQHQRSKFWAWLLVCIEGFIALVSLFSIKLSLHTHKNILGITASLAIFAISVWTITLAYRVTRFENRRISGGRRRRRPAQN